MKIGIIGSDAYHAAVVQALKLATDQLNYQLIPVDQLSTYRMDSVFLESEVLMTPELQRWIFDFEIGGGRLFDMSAVSIPSWVNIDSDDSVQNRYANAIDDSIQELLDLAPRLSNDELEDQLKEQFKEIRGSSPSVVDLFLRRLQKARFTPEELESRLEGGWDRRSFMKHIESLVQYLNSPNSEKPETINLAFCIYTAQMLKYLIRHRITPPSNPVRLPVLIPNADKVRLGKTKWKVLFSLLFHVVDLMPQDVKFEFHDGENENLFRVCANSALGNIESIDKRDLDSEYVKDVLAALTKATIDQRIAIEVKDGETMINFDLSA